MNKLSKKDKRQKSAPTDKIPGGLGQFTEPQDVDPKELEMGTEVEYEHTPNTDMAQDIALDHLTEVDDYYTRLEKMEEEAKEDGTYHDVEKVCVLISSLIKIANKIDKKGVYEIADEIDVLVKKMSGMSVVNDFIRALKEDNAKKAHFLLPHIKPSDFQLTDKQFGDLAHVIDIQALDVARMMLGITQYDKKDSDLGRPAVSKHLKDVFVEKKEEKGWWNTPYTEPKGNENWTDADWEYYETHGGKWGKADDGMKVRDIVEGKVKFDIKK